MPIRHTIWKNCKLTILKNSKIYLDTENVDTTYCVWSAEKDGF